MLQLHRRKMFLLTLQHFYKLQHLSLFTFKYTQGDESMPVYTTSDHIDRDDEKQASHIHKNVCNIASPLRTQALMRGLTNLSLPLKWSSVL